jgi:hypothetical protein
LVSTSKSLMLQAFGMGSGAGLALSDMGRGP